MGFVVSKTKYKKRNWRIKYQDRTGGKLKESCIAESRYRELGILPDMDIEDVRERLRSINSLDAIKRRLATRQKIDAKQKEEDEVESAFLSKTDRVEFERDVLMRKRQDRKVLSHWAAARRVIKSLGVEVQDWEFQKHKFYDHFTEKQWSLSYIQKVLPILNKWGVFLARKYRLPFLPIPYPEGRDRQRIADAYYDKSPKGRTPRPLTPKMLEEKRSKFSVEQQNWMYVSIWFGLRPDEVDHLAAGRHFRVEEQNGTRVLAIYQTKLASISREDRWKFIPIAHPEQEIALELALSRKLRRPLARIMSREFGDNVNTRSGRKNFFNMMLDLGHKFEEVSSWLGHQNVQRSWSNYRDRQRALFKKVS